MEVVKQIGYFYGTVRSSLHESGVVMRQKGIKRSRVWSVAMWAITVAIQLKSHPPLHPPAPI